MLGVTGTVVQYFSGMVAGSFSDRFLLGGTTWTLRHVIVGNDGGNNQLGAEVGINELTSNGAPFQSGVNTRLLFVGGPKIFYRWWMRIETGWSWGVGATPEPKMKASRPIGGPIINGTGDQGYTGYLSKLGFIIAECGTAGCQIPGGGTNTDSNHVISYTFPADSAWHEYIVAVKPNSAPTVADATFEVWVDNVVVGSANNYILHTDTLDTFAEGWGGWMVQPYVQLRGTASDGGTIYCRRFLTSNYYSSLI